MPDAVVQRYYNMLTVGLPNEQPLPRELQTRFESQMTYQHVRFLRGRDRYIVNPVTGTRDMQNVAVEQRKLFLHDRFGRLVCPSGYEPRIIDTLERCGYTVTYVLSTPPSPRRHVDAYEPHWKHLLKHVSLRDRQDDALVALASNDCGIFDAPPGFGKSFLMSAVGLLYPRARILICIRGTVLVEKTAAELTQYLPNVGVISGTKKQHGCRVTVCSADSLHHVPDDSVDIALVDEAHLVLADKYQVAFSNVLRGARIFGLSATIEGRSDGTDARREAIFGPVIFRMTQQEAVKRGLVVPIEVRWMNVFIPDNPAEGKRDVAHKRLAVWKNERRNQIIAECARRHSDQQVLIIVDTVTHAHALHRYLPEFELCYGNSDPHRWAAMVRNGDVPADAMPMNARDRENLRQRFISGEAKAVIATDVWSTGVSFNSLAVVIRADARSSKIMDTQIPGRVTRIDHQSGKQVGIVYDFLDQFDDTLRRRAATRRKNYEERGWAQLSQITHWPEAQTQGRRQRQLF